MRRTARGQGRGAREMSLGARLFQVRPGEGRIVPLVGATEGNEPKGAVTCGGYYPSYLWALARRPPIP
jgi:hypothetical protein